MAVLGAKNTGDADVGVKVGDRLGCSVGSEVGDSEVGESVDAQGVNKVGHRPKESNGEQIPCALMQGPLNSVQFVQRRDGGTDGANVGDSLHSMVPTWHTPPLV
jgi:hypothetical protein